MRTENGRRPSHTRVQSSHHKTITSFSKGSSTPCVFQQSHSEGCTTLAVYMLAFTIMSEFTRFFSSVGGKNTGIPPNESQYHHRTRLLESSTVTGWKSVSFPSCRRGAPARGQGQPVFSPRQPDIWAPTHWGRQGTRRNISQVWSTWTMWPF